MKQKMDTVHKFDKLKKNKELIKLKIEKSTKLNIFKFETLYAKVFII